MDHMRQALFTSAEYPIIDKASEIREDLINTNAENTFEPTKDSISDSDTSS